MAGDEWIPNQVPEQWKLDDGSEEMSLELVEGKRKRFIPGKGNSGNRTHVSVRMPASIVRKIDEYVQKGNDPLVKTRSDAVIDACIAWLYEMQDAFRAITPSSLAEIQIELSEQQMAYDDAMLERCRELLDNYRRVRNVSGIKTLLRNAKSLRYRFRVTAGETQQAELDKLIERIETILSDYP